MNAEKSTRSFQIVGLQSARRELGITQRKLGKVAGVATWTISQVERGVRGCQRSTRDALLGALQRLQFEQQERSRCGGV